MTVKQLWILKSSTDFNTISEDHSFFTLSLSFYTLHAPHVSFSASPLLFLPTTPSSSPATAIMYLSSRSSLSSWFFPPLVFLLLNQGHHYLLFSLSSLPSAPLSIRHVMVSHIPVILFISWLLFPCLASFHVPSFILLSVNRLSLLFNILFFPRSSVIPRVPSPTAFLPPLFLFPFLLFLFPHSP